MVFPSLFFQTEPGLMSQFTGFFILAFSFLIHRAKKWVLALLLLLSLVLIGQNRAHAIAMVNSMNYPLPQYNPMFPMQSYNNNFNFYGMPWGQVPPVYFYPNLPPYMGVFPGNYFMPHPVSPYNPAPFCPTCNQPWIPPMNPNQNTPPHDPLVS